MTSQLDPSVIQMVLVGSCGAGKSSLVNRIARRYPITTTTKPHSIKTYANFAVRDVRVKNKTYTVDMCDTHGHVDGFHLQYRGASVVLVVFDLTSRDSFQQIAGVLKSVQAVIGREKPCVIVGNKLDLELDRLVEPIEARTFALHNGVPYVETSAHSGENMQELFECIVEL